VEYRPDVVHESGMRASSSSCKAPIPCPVCSSGDLRTLRTFSSKEAAQAFVVAEGDRERHDQLHGHIESLWGTDQCSIRDCQVCGFAFADPFVSGDKIFYDLAFPRDGYLENKFEFSRTIEALQHIDLTGPVLEVGAGMGHFLKKISPSLLPPDRVTGMEFNPRGVETMSAAGFRAICGDLRSDLSFQEKFQAVFLFQVLEHLDDPRSVFEKLNELVLPEGHLFIAVPNIDLIEFHEQTDALQDMPPNHIGRWPVSALTHIGASHGFEMVASAVPAYAFHRFIRHDLGYSYLRRMQRRGTLANWSRRFRRMRGGRAIGAAAVLAAAPLRLPVWLRARKQLPKLGGCLWVHMQKSARPSGKTEHRE
jgi:SAM-dependent methyltransferase